MAETVTRLAHEVRDGDEVLEIISRSGNTAFALVQEKTLDEDDNVVLMVVVPKDALIRTHARPSELDDPFDEVPNA